MNHGMICASLPLPDGTRKIYKVAGNISPREKFAAIMRQYRADLEFILEWRLAARRLGKFGVA